ncbi:hypothetical protein LCGC14_0616840 [marine sediment metagenome]|uniref:Uncharacterized protein n=1 Tax=marine sediment metagenome TaxID=412755 RepID=A0A0F9RQB1_9ZZZZ
MEEFPKNEDESIEREKATFMDTEKGEGGYPPLAGSWDEGEGEAWKPMDPVISKGSYGFESNKEYQEYSELYESAWLSRIIRFEIPPSLKVLMLEKKTEGNIKYANQSFQKSIENTFRVDIKRHVFDELADILNYLFHWHICVSFLGHKRELEFVEATTRSLIKIYCCFPDRTSGGGVENKERENERKTG